MKMKFCVSECLTDGCQCWPLQKEQQQQQYYEVTLKPQQHSSLVQTSAGPQLSMPIYSIAASGSTLSISTSSSSSVPASVIVSSSAGSTAQPNRDLAQNHATTPESKGHLPHFPTSQSQQAMTCQVATDPIIQSAFTLIPFFSGFPSNFLSRNLWWQISSDFTLLCDSMQYCSPYADSCTYDNPV